MSYYQYDLHRAAKIPCHYWKNFEPWLLLRAKDRITAENKVSWHDYVGSF